MARTIIYPPSAYTVRITVAVTRRSDGETLAFEPVSLWAAWRMTRPRMVRRLFSAALSRQEPTT
jgi:hypothetical protein